MSNKTIPDVDGGFGDFIPVCREFSFPRADPRSRAYAAIPGGTVIGPVIEVHVVQLLGNHGLEIKNSISKKSRTNILGCDTSRKESICERIAYPRSRSQLLTERAIAEEGEPCSAELELSGTEETRAKPFLIQCAIRKEFFP